MAIAEVGRSSASGSSGANATLTHGITIAEDDVIVAWVHGDSYGLTISDDNGSYTFTEDYATESWNTSSISVFSRVAGASEPTSYTFDWSGNHNWSMMLMVFRGVDTTDIWDNAPLEAYGDGSGGTTTATAPTITTSTDGALGIISVVSDASGISYSSPSNGYGDTLSISTNLAQGMAYRTFATAGSTGTSALTASSTTNVWINQYALKPAVVTGTALGSVIGEGVLDPLAYSKSALLSSVSTSDILNALSIGTSTALGSIVTQDILSTVAASKSAALSSLVTSDILSVVAASKSGALGSLSTSDILSALSIGTSTALGSVTEEGVLGALATNKSAALSSLSTSDILSALTLAGSVQLGSIVSASTLSSLQYSSPTLLGSVVSTAILSNLSSGNTTLSTQDIDNIVAAMHIGGFLTVGEFLALK